MILEQLSVTLTPMKGHTMHDKKQREIMFHREYWAPSVDYTPHIQETSSKSHKNLKYSYVIVLWRNSQRVHQRNGWATTDLLA